MPKRTDIESILIIGAGPIIIGQACEFDYSGAQACKALKEEGFRVILVNSNPATIMTDPAMADATYIEPVEWQTVARIIEKERPDALLPTMGGQTALNCALDLAREKVLEKYGPSKISVSLDIKDDELITYGRSKKSGISYKDFTKQMVEIGINRFLVCDISRNGMLEGPNIDLSKRIAEETGAKVTHAGGIRNKDELLDIQKLVPIGVDSVIIGRALYENRFPCQKLWRVAESGIFN
jgi:hypothetical protein